DLLVLPRLALLIILALYLFLITIMWLIQGDLFSFFSKDTNLIKLASLYFPFVILVEGSRPLYEVHKYSLQALGFESLTLKITALSVMTLSFLCQNLVFKG
ncbi:MAG: MATE family efflux transporter, partial [Christensenellaceae bacterium]